MNTPEHAIILGIPIHTCKLDEATRLSLSAIDRERGQIAFACANPHSLVEANRDERFRQALHNSDLVVADGVGVTTMAKLVNIDLGPRITGYDFFFSVMNALTSRGGGRVFFFGSTEKVLALIKNRLKTEFPNLTICGALSPPFGDWSDAENDIMIEQINKVRPDVVWVGMTAPKQEMWVHRSRNALNAPLLGSIGAVFDFYAGTLPRAPRWMCKTGLEWLYRFIREPRRIWQRTLVTQPKFVLMFLMKHAFRIT